MPKSHKAGQKDEKAPNGSPPSVGFEAFVRAAMQTGKALPAPKKAEKPQKRKPNAR
jgi:hypothetical protein